MSVQANIKHEQASFCFERYSRFALFEDISARSGFGVPSFNLLGFGIAMVDLNLRDGNLDLLRGQRAHPGAAGSPRP